MVRRERQAVGRERAARCGRVTLCDSEGRAMEWVVGRRPGGGAAKAMGGGTVRVSGWLSGEVGVVVGGDTDR